MNASDRGSKHICTECATKYYDLRKQIVACPNCGSKPRAVKVPNATRPDRKTGRFAFGRYPR